MELNFFSCDRQLKEEKSTQATHNAEGIETAIILSGFFFGPLSHLITQKKKQHQLYHCCLLQIQRVY